MTGLYEPQKADDIISLIKAYPLGWLISAELNASPLPLLPELGPEGQLISLLGHCARHNILVDDFRANQSGLILFKGPDGYVSPSLISKPDWAPTWNYAVLKFRVEVELVESENRSAIEHLVTALEEGAWSTDAVGPRYDNMLKHIVAFRAHIVSTDHRFKLGQDESVEGFAEIVSGHKDMALIQWMKGQRRP